jgi:uncharacterized protein (DUF2267 family)
MDELVSLVSQKTGLSEDKARSAVQVVIEHLKGRLPAPLASQLDSYLSGGGGTTTASGLTDAVGGLFDKS